MLGSLLGLSRNAIHISHHEFWAIEEISKRNHHLEAKASHILTDKTNFEKVLCMSAVRWSCWISTQWLADVESAVQGWQEWAHTKTISTTKIIYSHRIGRKSSINDKNRSLIPKSSEMTQNILIKLTPRPLYTQDRTSIDPFPLHQLCPPMSFNIIHQELSIKLTEKFKSLK